MQKDYSTYSSPILAAFAEAIISKVLGFLKTCRCLHSRFTYAVRDEGKLQFGRMKEAAASANLAS